MQVLSKPSIAVGVVQNNAKVFGSGDADTDGFSQKSDSSRLRIR